MHEAVILVLNHQDHPLYRHHLDLIRERNPSYPVIPIHVQPADPLPGSIDVGGDPFFEPERGEGWSFCDSPLYQWYRLFGGCAKRYVFLEADTFAPQPLREFYGDELWNAPAAASVYATRETHPDWDWFRPDSPYPLPPSLDPVAAGVVPMCGVLLSDESLRAVANSPVMPSRVISELRLGTLLRYHGIPVSEFSYWRKHTVNCGDRVEDRTIVPGVYHPIKAR